MNEIIKMRSFNTSTEFKVLSIDFDVFNNLPESPLRPERDSYGWIIDYNFAYDFWRNDFVFYEHEYEQCLRFLSNLKQPVYVSKEHDSLYYLLNDKNIKSDLRIVNLDTHPDYAKIGRNGDISIGNWITTLNSQILANLYVDWFYIYLLGDDFEGIVDSNVNIKRAPYIDLVFKQSYDLVFICQSEQYSSAHLNHKLRKLINSCDNIISYSRQPLYRSYSQDLVYALQQGNVFRADEYDILTTDELIQVEKEFGYVWRVDCVEKILGDLPDCDPIYRGY